MTKYYIAGFLLGVSAALILLHPGAPDLFILLGPRLCLLTAGFFLPKNALVLANVVFLAVSISGLGVRPGILRLSFLSSVVGLVGRLELLVSAVCVVPFVWLLWLGFSGLSHAGVQSKGMLLDLFAVSLGEVLASGIARASEKKRGNKLDPGAELIPHLTFLSVVIAALLVRPLLDYTPWFQSALAQVSDSRALAVFLSCSVVGLWLWLSFWSFGRQLRSIFDSCLSALVPAGELSFSESGSEQASSMLPPSQIPPGDGFHQVQQRIRDISSECNDLRYRVRQQRRSARELSAILQDMPHAALLINGDGLIVFLSPTLKTLLGVNVEEPQGTSFLTLANSQSPFAEEFVKLVEATFIQVSDGNVPLSRVAYTSTQGGESLRLTITASNVYHAELDKETNMLSVFVQKDHEKKDFAVDLLRPQASELLGSMHPLPDVEARTQLEEKLSRHEESHPLNLLLELEILLEQVQSTLRLSQPLRVDVQAPKGEVGPSHHPVFDILVKKRAFGGVLRYLMSFLYEVLPRGDVHLSLSREEIGSGTGTFVFGAYPGRFVKLRMTFPLFGASEALSKILRDPKMIVAQADNSDFEIHCLLYLLSQQSRAAEGFLTLSSESTEQKYLELFLPESNRPLESVEEIAATELDLIGAARANAVFLGIDAKLAEQLKKRLAPVGFEMVFRSVEETLLKLLPPVTFEGSGFLDGEKPAEESKSPEPRLRKLSWGATRVELLIVEILRLDPETEQLLQILQNDAMPKTKFLIVPESLKGKVGHLPFRILQKPIDEGALEVEVQAALQGFSQDDEPQSLPGPEL